MNSEKLDIIIGRAIAEGWTLEKITRIANHTILRGMNGEQARMK